MKNKLVSSFWWLVSSLQHRTQRFFPAIHYPLKTNNSSRGFTLLLSVLVSSVLLALGFAIYNIVSKDIILSSSGRESQFAFYAADSGIECALYGDYQFNMFATSSDAITIRCMGIDVPLTRDDTVLGQRTTTFSFSLGTAGLVNPCTSVSVLKQTNPTRTEVVSSGYNTCVTTNPRRIERAIQVRY